MTTFRPPPEHPSLALPLIETVDQLAPEALPPFIAACAALQARAASRLLAPVPASVPVLKESERLLTVPEAASQLRLAPSYVYELARQGVLASVRRGRYVRITPLALAAFTVAHERGLDLPISDTLSAARERQGGPTAPHPARAQTDRTRGRTRRASDHGVEVGDRRSRGPRTGSETAAPAREHGAH